MKKLFYLVSFICLAQAVQAQNMVLNGDFESYTTCPSTLSQTTNCVGWHFFTTGTSDYFNCALSPTNTFGTQVAASGTGYMGGYSFSSNNQTSNTYKEYIAGPMNPLVVGSTYEVSMSVNLSDNSGYGTDDIGMFFYKYGPTSYPGSTVPPVTPQVTFVSYGPIIDKANWVRVVGTFYADSAYDNIVIGSWQQSAVSGKTATPPGTYCYYYYDSVVVRLVNKIGINYSDTMLCAGQTITVPYTVNNIGYFLPGNVFTLQLSDGTGSFAAPTVLATQAGTTSGSFTSVVVPVVPLGSGYLIRVKSNNAVDSSNVSLRPISIGNAIPAKPVITANNPACVGQSLNLNATTTTTGVTYKWTGPNSFTSGIQNPVISGITSAAGGDYIVTARLYGCVAKDTETVVVNPTPASITAGGNSPVCEGQALNLTSTNSSPGVTYSWTGPNSYTANTQNPTITNIPAAGNGDYIVAATLNGCSAKDTVTITVKPLPANFSASSNSPICTTKPINLFGNTTTGGVTFSWAGPAFTSSLQNPTIANAIPANAGDYILTATLNGCSIKDTETIVVNTSPAGAVIASANTPVCQNTPLNLTATSALTGSVYSWTGPSFTSGTQNPTISAVPLTGSGDYIVSVSLNGCTEKDTVTVTVLAAPTNVNATANTPLCTGQTLNLNVTNNTAGVSYGWTGPSFTANTQNPSIANATTGATGDYITTLSINGCVVKDTISVVVNPIPTTPTAGSNTPVCKGNPINLFAGASLPGATYNWSGPSYTSNQQNPIIPNANPGMTGIYAVTASLNGCTSPAATTNVNVLYYPSSVSVYVLPNDTICVGGTAQLIAVASNGGAAPQYRWLKNGFPISGATSISYNATTVTDKDKFRVILTPDNTCPDPDTSAPLEMTVLPYVKPEVSITATPTTVISPWQTITFHATPINGGSHPTYQWKRNGQDVVGAVNDTWGAYTLGDNDVISVVLYSSEICPSPATAISNDIHITVKLGVADVVNQNGWNIYPNPHSGSFHLTGDVNGAKEVKLSIVNVVGQVVYRQATALQSGKADVQVNMDSNIPNGIYLLRIDTGTDIIPVKMTLQR